MRAEELSRNTLIETVIVPDEMEPMFLDLELRIKKFFNDLNFDPVSGEITVSGQRYVLMRSDSMSHDFVDFVREKYSEIPEEEALGIAHNFLYDRSKVIGKKDAKDFHERLQLETPMDCLAAGPIHVAFTGWANVEIMDTSNPVPNKDFLLEFIHHNSFEAHSWKVRKTRSKVPVCKMNCGYSAGWCEESFGIPLTTVELTCEAMGDDQCSFIMATPERIHSYLEQRSSIDLQKFDIPVFFKRQEVERELRSSIYKKEVLIKEIHHRVKNNLQVISSLLRLQMDSIEKTDLRDEFESTINRVTTMALVHELMYQRKDFDKVDFKSYMQELIASLIQLNKIHKETVIDVQIDVPEVELDLEKSIPLGLILNEITCNAFKHGLKHGHGEFSCHLNFSDGLYVMKIGNSGKGGKRPSRKNSLGLALIDILCEQIEVEKEVEHNENGWYYTLKFKL